MLLDIIFYTFWMPFIEFFPINLIFSHVASIFEPIGCQNTTSMFTSATQATMRALRKENPSISISVKCLTRRLNIGQNSTTKNVMNSCFPINSLFFFYRIVEPLAFNMVWGLAFNHCLLKQNMVRIVEDRRRFRDDHNH